MIPPLNGKVQGGKEAAKALTSLAEAIRTELKTTVRDLGTALKLSVQRKLSGPVLKAPTGNLKGSINVKEAETPTGFTATVGTSLGMIPYARIHEYGGVILPVKAKMLSWIGPDGQRVFAHRVVMPERSYLRTSLAELEPTIEKQIRLSLKRAIKSAGFAPK